MIAVLLMATAARGDPKPSFAALPGGVVAISLPPALLQDAVIRKQIGSGLTTVFAIVAREPSTRAENGGRIEIRYDLWDDIWLVRKIDFDGRVDAQRLPSFDTLQQWWRGPARIYASPASRVALNVELRVLPFSAAEEKDARDWISKSGGVAAPSAAGTFVQTLIATTITARPIVTYRWTADVTLK